MKAGKYEAHNRLGTVCLDLGRRLVDTASKRSEEEESLHYWTFPLGQRSGLVNAPDRNHQL